MCPLVLSDANKNTRPLSEWQTTITRPLRYRWSIRSACSLSLNLLPTLSYHLSLSLSLMNYCLPLCPRPARISWTHSRTFCLFWLTAVVDSVVFIFSEELLLVKPLCVSSLGSWLVILVRARNEYDGACLLLELLLDVSIEIEEWKSNRCLKTIS